jgi:hypothetical protein
MQNGDYCVIPWGEIPAIENKSRLSLRASGIMEWGLLRDPLGRDPCNRK